MWRKLPFPKPFFLSLTQENGYCIYITDYVNIWWVYYKENELLSHLKVINDHLEWKNDHQLLEKALKILNNPESLKKLELTFEKKALNISMMLPSGPFYFNIKLTEGSKEMLSVKVTQQLLKTINDLKASEKELRLLLLKKDKEINEYKTETDIRIAKYLKSAIFNDEEHMAKHVEYQKNFGTSDIPKSILEQVLDKTEDQIIVKQEIEIKKVEPESQELIKNETGSHPVPEIHTQNLLSTVTVKEEIKYEPKNEIPKKKQRKMWKI